MQTLHAPRPDDTAFQGTHGALAGLDLGSNSFRLEIAHVTPAAAGDSAQQPQYRQPPQHAHLQHPHLQHPHLQHAHHYHRVACHKEIVRLGAGLDADGLLRTAAIQRGLDCLQRFGAVLQGFPAGSVRAVATQTLRAARNREAFLQPAHQLLGFPIEVINGHEEARLAYVGVAQLQPSDLTRLVIDIGGGSTELVVGQGWQVQHTSTFAVGGIDLSLRHFSGGHMTAAAFAAAQRDAAAAFGAALHTGQPFGRGHWHQALAASGTAGTVAQLLQQHQISDGHVTPAALRQCIAHCVAAGHVDNLGLFSNEPNRRAVLPGGLAILATLVEGLGIDLLLPGKGALRQGVIVDLARRLRPG